MNLDLHTLGVIGIAVGVSISLSFTLLGMVLRGLPALRIWAVAFWVLTAAALAQGLDESGTLTSAILGNGLIALANALMLMGIAVHVRYPLRWRWPIVYIVLYVSVQAALVLWPQSPKIEAVLFGAASIVWDGWMLWLLVWHAPRDLHVTCWCTALVFATDAGFYLVRSGLVLFPGAISSAMFNEVLVTGNYLFGILCTFLLSTGFTLMLAQRLTLDLRRLACTDGLTGLLNRTAVFEQGQRVVERCQSRGEPCCVLVFDLDSFKAVNDRWGHIAGDAVIRHFVDVLQGISLPESALFARYGGEEFVLVLPGVEPRQAMLIGEQMRMQVARRPARFAEQDIAITTSVGLATVSANAGFEALVMAADAALYRAKNRGRNRSEWNDDRDTSASVHSVGGNAGGLSARGKEGTLA
jgi:diguanylate cyclase (GGDEF)-like protein